MAPKAADKAKKEAAMAKQKAKAKVRKQATVDPAANCCCCRNSVDRPALLLAWQAAEDKTFGLKNKNKSAKVQK